MGPKLGGEDALPVPVLVEVLLELLMGKDSVLRKSVYAAIYSNLYFVVG